MILALAVILGLAVGFIRHRGQTADRIAAIPLHWAWLAILALVLQIPLIRSPFGPVHPVSVPSILFLLSHLLLLLFVWRNWQSIAIRIVGLGVVCNLLVMLANGGYMPITPETLVQINPGTTLDLWVTDFHYGYSKDVILLQQDTTLWFLSDILVVPPPFPWPAAFSLGDVFIASGIVLLLQGNDYEREPAPSAVHAPTLGGIEGDTT